MQFNLHAVTHQSTFVILDPASMTSGAADLHQTEEAAVNAWTSNGTAIAYSLDGDGSATFRILVNEALPSEWIAREECAVHEARLRVPSGRIMAVGIEDLWPQSQIDGMTAFEIPPGDYLADAFNVGWEIDEEELRSLAGKWSVRLASLVGTLIGFGVFGLFLGFACFAFVLFAGTWTPVKVAGVLLGAYALLVLPILLLTPWRRAMRRVRNAEQEIEDRHPDTPETVIWLRPIQSETKFNAGKFGIGFVELNSEDEEASPRSRRLGCFLQIIGLFVFCLVVALIIALVTDWVSHGNW